LQKRNDADLTGNALSLWIFILLQESAVFSTRLHICLAHSVCYRPSIRLSHGWSLKNGWSYDFAIFSTW